MSESWYYRHGNESHGPIPWGGAGALDSFWVKLRCAVLCATSGPRHPSLVSRGRKAVSAFVLLKDSPALVGLLAEILAPKFSSFSSIGRVHFPRHTVI